MSTKGEAQVSQSDRGAHNLHRNVGTVAAKCYCGIAVTHCRVRAGLEILVRQCHCTNGWLIFIHLSWIDAPFITSNTHFAFNSQLYMILKMNA